MVMLHQQKNQKFEKDKFSELSIWRSVINSIREIHEVLTYVTDENGWFPAVYMSSQLMPFMWKNESELPFIYDRICPFQTFEFFFLCRRLSPSLPHQLGRGLWRVSQASQR